MEPEKDGIQKESPFAGVHFQVPCLFSGVYLYLVFGSLFGNITTLVIFATLACVKCIHVIFLCHFMDTINTKGKQAAIFMKTVERYHNFRCVGVGGVG